MKGNRRNGYIHVYVGDTVIAYFEHEKDVQPREFKILEVCKRYGRVNKGMTRQNPLLKGRFSDTGEEKFFDNGFVQSIVRRSNVPQPKVNIYARDPHVQSSVTVRNSRWEGILVDLAALAMSKLPFDIERPINPERLHELYARQRAGIISKTRLYGCLVVYKVKRDLFQRWIRRNYTQICMTVKEITVQETETNTEYEKDYWRSVEADCEMDDRKRSEEEEWEEEMLDPYPYDLTFEDY